MSTSTPVRRNMFRKFIGGHFQRIVNEAARRTSNSADVIAGHHLIPIRYRKPVPILLDACGNLRFAAAMQSADFTPRLLLHLSEEVVFPGGCGG
jgi:hypothetical protein